MIISFGWTSDALLAGKKTVTRRKWSDRHYNTMRNRWNEGYKTHKAYSRSPRAGGKILGFITLIEPPYRERLGDMPDQDLEAEGGLWESREDFFKPFGDLDQTVIVVRFTFEPL